MTVRKYSPKRRRLYREGEEIDRFAVFERDGWICCVCDTLIDRTLRFPNEMAATLEHIVPLALGGTHTWDNVGTSHAKCNWLKGCNSAWTRFDD